MKKIIALVAFVAVTALSVQAQTESTSNAAKSETQAVAPAKSEGKSDASGIKQSAELQKTKKSSAKSKECEMKSTGAACCSGKGEKTADKSTAKSECPKSGEGKCCDKGKKKADSGTKEL